MPQHEPDHTPRSPASRRRFLQAGLAGAGAVAVGTATAVPATATPAAQSPTARIEDAATPTAGRTAHGTADLDSPRFTVVVMPDTQYLFDDQAIHPAPLAASVAWVLDTRAEHNTVFFAHLGDVTQNGRPNEMAATSAAFVPLDRSGLPWSVLAGNHDVSGDDQRGPTPYLAEFGPTRFARTPGYSASPDGYNTAHLFRAAGREWLLLALDWRTSDPGLAWAAAVIARHPRTPVILTIHELVGTDDSTVPATLSQFGQHVWDLLIKDNDQIFLSLNGHYWPPGRTTVPNAAGHDVHLHITNYQDRYYGGAAMIRLYQFDMERSTIDVRTINPWLLAKPYASLNLLEREELELTTATDAFAVPIDFTKRFAAFDPPKPRPARPARSVLLPGTAAYWRFDDGRAGTAVRDRVRDVSGHGNDLVVAGRPGRAADALTFSADHHPDQPGHGSLFFRGGRTSGDHLKTVVGAPLNATTGLRGFTVEAFFKLPADWGPDNAWSALLSRQGSSGDVGKTGGYSTTEPIAVLGVSGSVEPQWYVYPTNLDTSVTTWGHILPLDTWWHLAVTNDGRHTVMYVDGCPVVRNQATVTEGIATVGRSWLLGGHEDGGVVDQIHYGWIGDVRVVAEALPVSRFMIA